MLEELQFGFPLLTFVTFFPLVGALMIWAMNDREQIKKAALGVAAVEFVMSAFLLWQFVPETAAMQFSERHEWVPALGISYHVAVDGISILFVGLTAFLTPLLILYAWDTVKERPKAFFMSVLALETTFMGIFVSIDLILFFVFWELMLIPSYFLIKVWGTGADRQYAALKYVLYTLLGSVFMLVGFALLDLNHHAVTGVYSFDLLELLSVPVPVGQQVLIFWMMASSFEVFGISALAARIPFAVVGILGVYLAYRFVSRLTDSRKGLWAAFVMSTSPFYFFIARQAITDIVFCVFMLGALGCFLLVVLEEKPRWRDILGIYIFAGLAALGQGLRDLGAAVDVGAGVEAAMASLSASAG